MLPTLLALAALLAPPPAAARRAAVHELRSPGGKCQSESLWDNILYDVPFRSSSLALARQMEPVLDRFRDWGVCGIQVHFMDRDDQPMVAFYRRVAEEAARRHLFVDFHGAFKPLHERAMTRDERNRAVGRTIHGDSRGARDTLRPIRHDRRSPAMSSPRSRREFLAASALTGLAIPAARAASVTLFRPVSRASRAAARRSRSSFRPARSTWRVTRSMVMSPETRRVGSVTPCERRMIAWRRASNSENAKGLVR